MSYIAYCRVSTSHQNEINQHFAIQQFADKNNIHIDRWVEEKISSSKKLKKRKLGELLDELKDGDILITTEISRISRSITELFNILETCLKKNCQVWTLKENYRLGNDIQSKVLAFCFGLTAELSKQLLQQRTKETMARLKAEGRILGRPIGHKSKELKLSKNKTKIQRLLNKKIPKAQIARIFNVNKTTFYRFLKRYNIKEEE
ncbi:MAG: recombinase family protein [Alphaproteobacteria bacterium]|nr:recombinase family protein [Alphaproteobacteria bacterium]